jgi:hypothetical protein
MNLFFHSVYHIPFQNQRASSSGYYGVVVVRYPHSYPPLMLHPGSQPLPERD